MSANLQVQFHAVSASAEVSWRVLSGNNRACARSASTYSDVAVGRLAVAELQRAVAGMKPRIRRVEPNRFVWELHLVDRAVITSGHAFDRIIRCEQGLEQFRAGFSAAELRVNLVLSGARRWGSVAS